MECLVVIVTRRCYVLSSSGVSIIAQPGMRCVIEYSGKGSLGSANGLRFKRCPS